MSADNEIAIYRFNTPNGGHVFYVEEIQGCPSSDDIWHVSYITDQTKKFDTETEARNYAFEVADYITRNDGILEYGVTFYKYEDTLEETKSRAAQDQKEQEESWAKAYAKDKADHAARLEKKAQEIIEILTAFHGE